MMLDLGPIAAHAAVARAAGIQVALPWQVVVSLVTELDAAREVIRVGRELNEAMECEPADDGTSYDGPTFDEVIAAYDKAAEATG